MSASSLALALTLGVAIGRFVHLGEGHTAFEGKFDSALERYLPEGRPEVAVEAFAC